MQCKKATSHSAGQVDSHLESSSLYISDIKGICFCWLWGMMMCMSTCKQLHIGEADVKQQPLQGSA